MAGPNNWEFLLQQEGDRSWLPLESPDVEILEGRYRVMVKTAVPDTVMDIRITHEFTDELPTKRRTQVRSGETNARGLLLVIPFTQMQPGVWELAIGVPHDASRDEARGATHHYSVQLHVLPKESDVAGEWEPDWSQPAPALNLASEPELASSPESSPEAELGSSLAMPDETMPDETMPDETEHDLTTSEDDLFASLDGLISEWPTVQPELLSESVESESVEIIELTPIASPPIVSTVAEPIVPQSIVTDSPIDRQTITLSLQPNSYEIQREQTIVVECLVQANCPGSLPECTFVVRVQDPQQGDLVVERSTPFTAITLPLEMQLSLLLPAELPSSSMLMGEVCLMDDRTGDTLAIDRFTLFAPLSDLLATLQDLESQTRSPLVDELPHPPAEPSGPELDDQFLGLVNQPVTSPTSFQVQPKSQLPPKLYQPDQNRDDRPSPSLPTFLTPPTPEADVQTLFDDFAIDDVMADEFSFDDPIQLEDAILENALDVPSDIPSEVPPEENLLLPVPVPALASSETGINEGFDRFDDGLEAAFLDNDLDQNLDLSQSEFAFNINAPLDLDDPDDLLTIDINAQQITDRSPSDDRFESLNLGDRFMDRMSALAEETKTESINAIPPTDAPSINPFASTRCSSSAESVVIMDDLFNLAPTALDKGDNPLLIGADELVPTPSLEVEAVNEVVAGQSLMVKVKLPMIQPKLYVKLWINDRQTRTLLDGPRYLVDFVPDAQYRSMEATTTFTVPLGSLEIQIEAIAIETATKREGYKVSSPLAVVPPNLPGIGLEDFNF